VETAKSVSDVLATCDGTLLEWSVGVGSVLPVGSSVGMIRTASAEPTLAVSSQPTGPGTAQVRADTKRTIRNRQIPPRTKKLLEHYNLLDEADLIPRRGETLLPEDVETYLQARQEPEAAGRDLVVRPLTAEELVAIRRLEGNTWTSPPTITMRADWTTVEAAIAALGVPPERRHRAVSGFVAWSAAQAMMEHPLFRTRLGPGEKCTTTIAAHVGIAVTAAGALPSIANLRAARDMSWREFQAAAEQAIEEAAADYGAADPMTTVIVTNMMPFEVHVGMPSLVAPAVAVIAVGDVYHAPLWNHGAVVFGRVFNLSMTFDHRLIGGAHAARFLQAVKGKLANVLNEIPTNQAPPRGGLRSATEVLDAIRHRFALELGVNPDLIPIDVPIANMGLDSIMVVELAVVGDKLARFAEERFAVKLGDAGPLTDMSLQAIASSVLQRPTCPRD
jgi:pyruvate/2-oxoglutarate dehydrogenase complex dihydrolipoamide acyltransferase (E2) component